MKQFSLLMLALALSVITGSNVAAQRITVTGVGTGIYGFNGDGMASELTQINSPYDVCLDAAHNLYFTDQANGRVRKVSAVNGTVSTIAGGGTSLADGIPALSAAINPYFMCIDAAGNVYFSAPGIIRKINAATGIITTVAGTGTPGYSGDGGAATSAMIQGQLGICVDAAQNVYLADGANNVIRKVTAATGIISTIAGNGTAGYTGDGGPASAALLSSPTVICIDRSGNLFFADQSYTTGGLIEYSTTNFIREISAATGNINTVVGNSVYSTLFDCTGLNTFLGCVTGICCDSTGNCFFNEISCSCRKLDVSTGYVTAVAGNFAIESYDGNGGNSLTTWMNYPYGICADASDNLYVADNQNDRIRTLIQVSHTPSFAYGHGQSVSICEGANIFLGTQMTITDIDSAQTETFTVLSAPAHGTLSGFPYSMLSTGQDTVAIPSGVSYTASSGYIGTDVFKVVVSDGALSDTLTLYVNVNNGTPAIISGAASVCLGNTITLSNTDTSGTWTISNGSATITPGSGSAIIAGTTVGVDTILYNYTNTCGTGTTMQIVAVQTTPISGTITGADNVVAGSTITLTDPATGGVWSSLDNTVATISPTGVVTGLTPGGDAIFYTVTNACGSTAASYAINISAATTSVASVSAANDALIIAPNPARSQFTINVTSSYNEPVTINITNIAGEQLKQITGTTNNNITAQLEVPAGIYLIQAVSAHQNSSSKVIME